MLHRREFKSCSLDESVVGVLIKPQLNADSVRRGAKFRDESAGFTVASSDTSL